MSSWILGRLVLFVVCILPPLLAVPCHNAETKNDVVHVDVPSETYVEIGKELNLHCKLLNKAGTYRKTNISFTPANLVIRVKNRTYNISDDHIQLKEDGVVYRVKNATREDTGSYNCFAIITDANGELGKLPGCYAYVKVGTKPQRVKNFNCTVMAFQNLTCRWQNPDNGDLKTNYSVEYRRFREHGGYNWAHCPTNTSIPNSCTWLKGGNPLYRVGEEVFEFKVTGSNALGTQYWNDSSYIFNHTSLVQLSPVRELTADNVEKRSAKISWLKPIELTAERPNMTVVYTLEVQVGEEVKQYETYDETITFSELVPNTVYVVALKCRPEAAKRLDLYSKVVNITLKTLKDIPDAAPVIERSGFKTKMFNQKRHVTLLFQEIPKDHWNDDVFNYIIQVYPIGGGESFNLTATHSNFEIEDLDRDRRYEFVIWSKNSLGLSPTSSSIVVFEEGNLLSKPTDVSVVFNSSMYLLTWKTPPSLKSRDDLQYSVFWCLRSSKEECNGSVEARNVDGALTATIKLDTHKDYIFGVSVSDDKGRSSGSQWDTCMVQQGANVGKIQVLELTPDTETSLKLKWSAGCSSQRSVIGGYQVEYCKTNSEAVLTYPEECQNYLTATNSCSMFNFSVTDDEDIYVIDGLEKNQVYRVVLRSLDRTTGRWTPDSVAACARTEGLGLGVHMIVGIAVGSALGLMVLVFSLYILAKWMQKKLELAKQIKVQLPQTLDNTAVEYSDFVRRVTEFNNVNMNGGGDHHDQHIMSDLSKKDSHSGLDKLIKDKPTSVTVESSVDTKSDSRVSANLYGELSAEQAPIHTPVPARVAQEAAPMPPYTQLGLSTYHLPPSNEQPGNTGYSQLSVVPPPDSPPDSPSSSEPPPISRNGGYVPLDRAMAASAPMPPVTLASNGYVPVQRANQ